MHPPGGRNHRLTSPAQEPSPALSEGVRALLDLIAEHIVTEAVAQAARGLAPPAVPADE